MLRTKEMWTPRPRWTPAQVRQMKMPNLGDAHCGEGAPQSQQTLLLDSFCRAASYNSVSARPVAIRRVEGQRGSLTLDRVSGSTSHMALEAIVGY